MSNGILIASLSRCVAYRWLQYRDWLAAFTRWSRPAACKAERPLTLTHHRHAGDYIIHTATHQIRPNQPYTTSLTATTKPAKA